MLGRYTTPPPTIRTIAHLSARVKLRAAKTAHSLGALMPRAIFRDQIFARQIFESRDGGKPVTTANRSSFSIFVSRLNPCAGGVKPTCR